MTLCKTITPKSTRYYVDGKRVSPGAFEHTKFGRRQDSFLTKITPGGVTRHFSSVRAS